MTTDEATQRDAARRKAHELLGLSVIAEEQECEDAHDGEYQPDCDRITDLLVAHAREVANGEAALSRAASELATRNRELGEVRAERDAARACASFVCDRCKETFDHVKSFRCAACRSWFCEPCLALHFAQSGDDFKMGGERAQRHFATIEGWIKETDDLTRERDELLKYIRSVRSTDGYVKALFGVKDERDALRRDLAAANERTRAAEAARDEADLLVRRVARQQRRRLNHLDKSVVDDVVAYAGRAIEAAAPTASVPVVAEPEPRREWICLPCSHAGNTGRAYGGVRGGRPCATCDKKTSFIAWPPRPNGYAGGGVEAPAATPPKETLREPLYEGADDYMNEGNFDK